MKNLHFLGSPKFWGAFFLCCALFLTFSANADADLFEIGIEWDTLTEVDFATVEVASIPGGRLEFEIELNTSVLGTNADLQYFFFNLADGLTGVSVSGADVDGFTFDYSDLTTNPKSGFRANGDGYYDVVVDFGSGANPTVQDTDFFVDADQALDIASILFGSEGGPKGSYYMGIHAQTTTWAEPDGTVRGSEWAGVPIPEPATMLLVGSGLIGLAGFGRKKFFKK